MQLRRRMRAVSPTEHVRLDTVEEFEGESVVVIDVGDLDDDDPMRGATVDAEDAARVSARASAARALVAVRTRTRRPIPRKVLELAKG